jgi:glycosyltransferase EpsD
MPKALLTATVQSHIAQFHEPAIALLQEHGYEVHVAARDNLAEKNGLTLSTPDRVLDVPFERNPLSPRNVRALRQLRNIVMSGGYDLIHCNTPVAGIVTRLVAAPLRRRGTIVVYTAHGFHFYTGAPLLNWIVYYPLERAFAGLTDALITINREDYVRAMKFPSATVHYLPGVGVELQRFETAPAPGANLRRELGLAPDDFVVLSVGELNENKNHATVLRAMAQMKTPVIHYLICGNGPRREELEDLARQTGVSERVHFLGYRRDIPSILASADIFCLPSFREGLPMALMEAMAAGKPLVCSRIRGSVDLVDPGEGGVIVEPSDISGFARAFDRLAADSELRQAMGRHNRERVRAFSTDAVTMALAEVYGLPGSGRGAQ